MARSMLALVTVFSLASIASAAEPKKALPAQQQKAAPPVEEADDEGVDCTEAQSSQLGINLCAARGEKEARKAMEASLAAALKKDAKKAAAVKAQQAAFEKAANARCDKEGNKVKGGSMYTAVVAGCRGEQWKKRSAELDKVAAKK